MPATDDEKLDSYKYFKQATVGDCNIDAPGGMMAMVGLSAERRKWDAWNSVKGTSSDDAKKKYVDAVADQRKKCCAPSQRPKRVPSARALVLTQRGPQVQHVMLVLSGAHVVAAQLSVELEAQPSGPPAGATRARTRQNALLFDKIGERGAIC